MSVPAWMNRLSVAVKWQIGLVLASLAITTCYATLASLFAPETAVSDGFHRCDSFWYETIAEHGYPWSAPGSDLGHSDGADVYQTPWGFFPLYPWTVSVVSKLTGLPVRDAMFALAWLLSIALPLVMFRTFLVFTDEHRSGWASLVMLCFPFGIYAHLHMTEAPYVIALMASFLAVAVKRPWLLALSTATLVLVRPNGAIMLFPVLLFILDRAEVPLKSIVVVPGRVLRMAWPLVFPVLAVVGYCAYQWHMTGIPVAFMEAERGWGRHFTWPLMGFFRSGDAATQFESWYTIGLVITVFAVGRKLERSLRLLVWLAILLPLCSGTVSDMMRYTSVMFPLFLLAGNALTTSQLRIPVVIASFALQLVWFWMWLAMIGGWLAC